MKERFANFRFIHTSGHASHECIAKVCNVTKPRSAIIPIHSECYADIFKLQLSDGLKEKVVCSSVSMDDIDIVVH